jgi:6-pyruvoyltetrahydropterin/6-carboxytetrahydropterin synthase
MKNKKESLYTLRRLISFDSAHQLLGYDGPCARVHGHTYKLEVEIQGKKLDAIGMLIDCYDIKQHIKPIVDQLDHHNINEIPPFTTINPTAENIAAWIFDQLSDSLNAEDVYVHAVTLWETELFSVRYEKI